MDLTSCRRKEKAIGAICSKSNTNYRKVHRPYMFSGRGWSLEYETNIMRISMKFGLGLRETSSSLKAFVTFFH